MAGEVLMTDAEIAELRGQSTNPDALGYEGALSVSDVRQIWNI